MAQSLSKRIRGRKGVALRAQVRRDEPLCRTCKAKGLVRATEEIDHIIPLAAGGSNGRDNMQGLCGECHAEKTALDNARYAYGYDKATDELGFPKDDWHPSITRTTKQSFSIPHFLQKSAIPVTLVTGPPASGKSSYIEQHAGPDDIVVDFDIIRESIGAKRYDPDPDVIKRTFKIRNSILRSLSQRTTGKAWVAVMAPTGAERAAWVKALGNVEVVQMKAGRDECKRRIANDPKREGARDRLCDAVDRWFSERT